MEWWIWVLLAVIGVVVAIKIITRNPEKNESKSMVKKFFDACCWRKT